LTNRALDRALRAAGGRIIAALAARYRDLDLAEEAVAEACLAAAEAWPRSGAPQNPVAWLYRVADRNALDGLRRRGVRDRLKPEPPPPEPTAEDLLLDDDRKIPDERLRLIFICCHPAISPDARAALTLRLVCGLSTREIARAFLVAEAALAQRLTRAKRKIAEAGVPFTTPGPEAWGERLAAVLTTLELAYAKAHEDAAGTGEHAGFAQEILALTRLLTQLLPNEEDAHALAALVRFAEARRPARLDERGVMTPLSEQNPALWRRSLIVEGGRHLRRAWSLCDDRDATPRVLQATLHGVWCARRSLSDPPPWPQALALYDELLRRRDDPVTRLNRAVALAEVKGAAVALAEVDGLIGETAALQNYLPFHAVRADLLRREGRREEALAAYEAALALAPSAAERAWLEARRDALPVAP
jgi:RNA polymerase sigma-70 factor, ECF subfamily